MPGHNECIASLVRRMRVGTRFDVVVLSQLSATLDSEPLRRDTGCGRYDARSEEKC